MSKYPRVIYMITHNITGKIYIGSTSNLDIRIRQHLQTLRAGKHIVEDMQYDFDEYGENYHVETLGYIRCSDERDKEYDMMKLYKSHKREIGYNYKDRNVNRKKPIEKPKTRKKSRSNKYPNLRAEMARYGINATKLAKGLGKSPAVMSKKLTGRYEITLGEAVAIKSYIGVDIPLEILFEEEV